MTGDFRKDILRAVTSHHPTLFCYKDRIADEIINLLDKYHNEKTCSEMKSIDVFGLPEREY